MADEHLIKADEDLIKKLSFPAVEDVDFVLVDEKTLREAQLWISGCENCTDDAPITFDYLLDAVTGSSPAVTEYIMCHPITCPFCAGPITEKTLILVV